MTAEQGVKRNSAAPSRVGYERLLVAYDGAEPSDGALELAAYLASRTGARVDVVHVVEIPRHGSDGPPAQELITRPVGERRPYWEQRLDHLIARAAPELAFHGKVLTGDPIDELLHHAERTQPDLLLAGTHGVGRVRHALLGSVSHRLLRHAKCDLLFVRRPLALERPPAVLVGVDAWPSAQRAVQVGDRLAQALESRLVLVHVAPFPPFDGSPYLEDLARARMRAELRRHGHEILEAARARVALPADRIVEDCRDGYVRDEMTAACNDHAPAIVVVGTRGTEGFPGLLVRSVTRDVLEHSHDPVLVVRPRPSS